MLGSWSFLLICSLLSFSSVNCQDDFVPPKGPPVPPIPKQCPTLYTRKNWMTLSNAEKDVFGRAVVALNIQGHFKYFCNMHKLCSSYGIHGTNQFGIWHRYFIWYFEHTVRELVIKSKLAKDFALPYWEPIGLQQTFEEQDVFKHLGPANSDQKTNCLLSGHFKELKVDGTCVSRGQPDRTKRILPSAATINAAFTAQYSFRDFSRVIEYGVHGIVHKAVGGSMSTMGSPCDPLFFLHHANIDRKYARYQQLNPQATFADPEGDESEQIYSPLVGFPNVKISDVFNIHSMCYKYDDVPVLRPDFRPPAVRRAVAVVAKKADFNAPVDLKKITESTTKLNGDDPKRYLTTLLAPGVLSLGEVGKILYASTLDDDWIKVNNLNRTKVKIYEASRRATVDKLNDLPGYTPPGSIINRKRYLKSLLEKHGKTLKKVGFYFKGKHVEVDWEKDSDFMVVKLRNAYLALLPKQVPTLKDLEKIIGKNVYNEKSPINPFLGVEEEE